jgi:hypothetical protein
VTLASDPPGLQGLADRAEVFSPVTLDWGVGTTHMLGAQPRQTDLRGSLWLFDSWSNGGGMSHPYTVSSTGSLTLTAKFVPGGRVPLSTSPPGLNLVVDGIAAGPPYNMGRGRTPHGNGVTCAG